MPPLLMAGFDKTFLPTRTVRESAREHADQLSPLVSSGRVTGWDLFRMLDCTVPGAAEWADKALEDALTAAVNQAVQAMSAACTDCEDIGFYGLPSREDPDILTSLLRRQGDNGYEQLTAAGEWRAWEPSFDQPLEILTRELATDLAEALTAGASGLARRYFWPKAFLPPGTLIAAAPAPELTDQKVPDKTSGAETVTAGPDDGWREYAVVDDLDPGAVLEVIRLRRGDTGPELVAYRNGVWDEAPELLTELQGVQPPPLVELDQSQLDSVMGQIGQDDSQPKGDSSPDTGDAGTGTEADSTPAPAQPPAKADQPVPEEEKYLQDKNPLAAAGPSTQERAKAAEKGQALPEGGFPIKNRDDLGKAIKALGRATNKTAAKRHIIKRARALNAISALPEAWGVTAAVSLVADAPLTVSPDPRAEKLRRYWTTGKGALKIRWGTPGDWTRCYRQLRKHMGLRAKGYCQNLHKRATGVWAGDRKNPGRAAALAAAGVGPAALSMEAALVAAVSTGRWTAPEGVNGMLKDGIYTEGGSNIALLKTLTAGGFPVDPPDDWFADPLLASPTPLTVDDDGRVYGHIATFDVAHIGLPGNVRAPRSRSGYAYFKTGELRTASGKKVNVGQLTLAGGHASLQADAAAAVAHYDNTGSAVADVTVGEDRFGIWVAGGLRPEVTPAQLRTLRASAPSGDWRPINGHLELVACCQVNVPGFPTVRARVASGAITSLVAAGAPALYARRLSMLADASVAERVAQLESIVFDSLTEAEIPADAVTADAGDAGADAAPADGSVTEGIPSSETPDGGEKPVSDAVKRARALAAERRAAHAAEQQPTPAADPAEEAPAEITVPGEEPAEQQPETDLVAETAAEDQQAAQVKELQVDRHATAAQARMAELRVRVHGNRKPVAASGGVKLSGKSLSPEELQAAEAITASLFSQEVSGGALTAALGFDPLQPRDSDGRWIEVGQMVSFSMDFDGFRPHVGTVIDKAPPGSTGNAVEVQENDTGITYLANTNRVKVIPALAELPEVRDLAQQIKTLAQSGPTTHDSPALSPSADLAAKAKTLLQSGPTTYDTPAAQAADLASRINRVLRS